MSGHGRMGCFFFFFFFQLSSARTREKERKWLGTGGGVAQVASAPVARSLRGEGPAAPAPPLGASFGSLSDQLMDASGVDGGSMGKTSRSQMLGAAPGPHPASGLSILGVDGLAQTAGPGGHPDVFRGASRGDGAWCGG